MKTQTVAIQGMHCQACEKVVSKRISQLPGVSSVTVDIEKGTASVLTELEITQSEVIDVLKDTHYTVTSLDKQNS